MQPKSVENVQTSNFLSSEFKSLKFSTRNFLKICKNIFEISITEVFGKISEIWRNKTTKPFIIYLI